MWQPHQGRLIDRNKPENILEKNNYTGNWIGRRWLGRDISICQIEETVAHVAETPVAEPDPAVTEPAAKAPAEAPTETTEAAAVGASKMEVKEEVTLITDGILGYERPGLVK